MRYAALLFPFCLFAQSPVSDAVIGNWVNQNRDTGGITQITVRRDGARTIAHAWGACHPVDCDWGEAEAGLWNGIPMAVWKHGFSTVRMQLVEQPDGRLLAAYRSEYNDGSGREDPGHAEFFARERAHPEGDPAARALLEQVAENYRRLPDWHFELDETVTRAAGTSESRTVKHMAVLYRPPDRVRVESSGAGGKAVTICDGESEWEVYPAANEYTVTPQEKGPLPWPVGLYSLLDKGRAVPRILGREGDSTIVELAMGRGVTSRLWIDDATRLIRKEAMDEGRSGRRETVYTLSQPGVDIPPDSFRYDPAATQAKDRRQLSREAPRALTGAPAPDFTLRGLDGADVRLAALRGKAVLLDFWGTWCGPCRQALPTIELLNRGLGAKGLAVYGVGSDEPEIAREYLRKNGYTMPSLVDSAGEAAAAYHVRAWPTTVLIDRDGKVTYYAVGHDPEKLRDALRLLGLW